MSRILGIDPGSRVTGFGVIDFSRGEFRHVYSERVAVAGDSLADRLRMIFEEVDRVVNDFSPTEVAIERVFVKNNADSALKLGQARGAAICAAASYPVSVSEYTPAQIKQAVVGNGRAAKTQVQHMVRVLLGLSHIPETDVADALACALCHGQTAGVLSRLRAVRGRRRGRWQ